VALESPVAEELGEDVEADPRDPEVVAPPLPVAATADVVTLPKEALADAVPVADAEGAVAVTATRAPVVAASRKLTSW
jgi:hypothetical protein